MVAGISMRWLLALCGTATIVAAGAAGSPGLADEGSVVVELYTSQGCSSCPPADDLLREVARQPGVIALALHVDYWDYLGWEDPFGRAENTERQKAYAKAHGARTIYTPQMVVDGADLVIGHDGEALRERIAAHAVARETVAITAERREGGLLGVSIAPTGAPTGPADVHVVGFVPSHSMTVEGGENAGYSAEFVNIVTAWVTIGRWDGAGPVEFTYALEPEVDPDSKLAIIVQAIRHGPILAAITP
jgi:hypothetical protein